MGEDLLLLCLKEIFGVKHTVCCIKASVLTSLVDLLVREKKELEVLSGINMIETEIVNFQVSFMQSVSNSRLSKR